MDQVLQVAGALLVLAGFTLAQLRMVDQQSYPYLLLNLIGSVILAVLAVIERQWGFLLLEGAWAIVSLLSMIAHLRGHSAPAAHEQERAHG